MKKEETFVTANREYKDTMFRMIFREKRELLSLYNAVNNSNYQKEEHLYEHQSTYNPNMPLRDLFYVSREYQKLVEGRSI